MILELGTMNFNYQMRFSKTGRARFIAHLDTLSLLVRAIRRAGYQLALTEGMRPKPILSLAMPLGVGIEGEDEICDFSLRQRVPLGEFSRMLGRQLPEGIDLKSIGPCHDRSKSASRVARVSYRVQFSSPVGWGKALEKFNSEKKLTVMRKRPKGDKNVDVKRYVDKVGVGKEGCLEFDMAVTSGGTARPEEVIGLLEEFAGRPAGRYKVIRTAIILDQEKPLPPPRPGHGKRLRR